MCCKKINLHLFDIVKNDQIFPSKFAIFNMITGSILVEKWGILDVAGGMTGKTYWT